MLDSYLGMPSGIPQLARLLPASAAAAAPKILDSYQGMPSGIPQLARIHPALAAAAAAASQNPRFVSGYAFRHTAACENPSGFSRCRPSSLPHTLPPAPKCYHDRILGPLP